jgi:hypothetical protein
METYGPANSNETTANLCVEGPNRYNSIVGINLLFTKRFRLAFRAPRLRVMNMRLAQITGMAVTTIVVFGTDLDVMYAVPLGIFAGALAMFFAALGEARFAAKKI